MNDPNVQPPAAPAAPPPPAAPDAAAPAVPLQQQLDSNLRAAAGLDARVSAFEHLRTVVSRFLERHGRKLWWMHSTYALALGVFVVSFAQKGFHRARWLAVSLGVAWFVMVYFFRLHGSGNTQTSLSAFGARERLRFLVMTYVLKNMYQSMLFFLLPFYWKAATPDAPNALYVALLAACAVLSTVDIVFDRYLMRWKAVATVFHGATLFSCLNLLVPAVFARSRTLYTLMAAGGFTVVVFWTMHFPLSVLRAKRYMVALAVSVAAGVGLAYVARAAIPPVPMHLSYAAVGPAVLRDGRLAMEVRVLHSSMIQQLRAVTDVVIPGGAGDRLRHVWRHEGREVQESPEDTSRAPGPRGSVRLRSSLSGQRLPARLAGDWSVDVETEDGQLVGRTSFRVIE